MTATAPTTGTDDPTAVFGRRVLAWLVDTLLFTLVVGGAFAVGAEYVAINDSTKEQLAEQLIAIDGEIVPGTDVCDGLEIVAAHNAEVAGEENDLSNCVEIAGRAYLIENGDRALPALAWLAWPLLIFVLLQGLTGVTPGKALVGLRTVDLEGSTPGLGRAFIRTILWIVDGIPFFFGPVLGGFVALTSSGHRRIGDIAARTYVVDRSAVGRHIGPAAPPAEPGPWSSAPPPVAPAPTAAMPVVAPPADPVLRHDAPPVDETIMAGDLDRLRAEAAASIADAPPPSGPPVADPTPPDAPPPTVAANPIVAPGASEPTVADNPVVASTPEPQTPTFESAPPTEPAPPVDPAPTIDPTPPVDQPPPVVATDPTSVPAPPGATTPDQPTIPPVDDATVRIDRDAVAAAAGFSPTEPAPSTPPITPPVAQPAPQPAQLPPPQWDQARNTYIQWDGTQWLQWDYGRNAWKPIDT